MYVLDNPFKNAEDIQCREKMYYLEKGWDVDGVKVKNEFGALQY